MKKFVFAIFAVTIAAMSTGVQATGDAECHLYPEGDDTIVMHFPGDRIYSDFGGNSPSSFQYNYAIPAGTYNVWLESYDGHIGRVGQNQENEQYFVDFRKGGEKIATSGTTGDLADDVDFAYWSGKVSSYITFDKNVDNLIVQHAKVNGNSANSLMPVCMMFHVKKDPVCGNGTLEKGEQCDDGNNVDNDQCSNKCEIPKEGPMCGNGIVEAGEVCDDGNTVNDDQCTNICTIPTPEGPSCGNGIVEAGEQCDAGKDGSDTCSTSCKVIEDEEEDDEDCDGSIGNTVWNDRNGNGVQDEGEEGISGVKVKLQYGDEVDKEYTNSKGRYEFDDLCEDTYRVIVASETLDAGCYPTYDRDGVLDHIYKHKLDEGDEYKKADFGYRCPSTKGYSVSPKTGAGSLTGAASALSAAAVALISYRRMRDDVA